jgi:hypothetical protein
MTISQNIDYRELLQYVYNSFNARDIDAALEVIHPHADWANALEGGLVQGHTGIRDYWSRQWSYMDPHVKPVYFEEDEEGRFVVEANQIIRDLKGNIVSIKNVHHVFQIEEGLIRNMRIRPVL